MSEWTPCGNPMPPHFTGQPTKRQQYTVDLWEAEKHLEVQLPEQCRNCMLVRVNVLNHIASEVIKGSMTTTTALSEMRRRTQGCVGPQYDEGYADKEPDCPVVEAERQSNRTQCW